MNRRTDPQYIETPGPLDTPCWIWQWTKQSDGYGMVRDHDRMRLAHVVYYEHIVGEVPLGLELDHLCRDRACVNADHLEAVTHAENSRRGANAKLTAADAIAIRAQYAAGGVTQKQLARRYGVNSQSISHVVTHKTWRNLAPASTAA